MNKKLFLYIHMDFLFENAIHQLTRGRWVIQKRPYETPAACLRNETHPFLQAALSKLRAKVQLSPD